MAIVSRDELRGITGRVLPSTVKKTPGPSRADETARQQETRQTLAMQAREMLKQLEKGGGSQGQDGGR